jgi:hypothetical protein
LAKKKTYLIRKSELWKKEKKKKKKKLELFFKKNLGKTLCALHSQGVFILWVQNFGPKKKKKKKVIRT